jgi:hypothetical protein
MTRRVALAGLLALALAIPARAGVIYTLSQVGPDVVGTGSGSFNITALTFSQITLSFDADMNPILGRLLTGNTLANYRSISGPANFGSGVGSFAPSTSGDFFGVQGSEGILNVPQGYTSGSPLSATNTWSGQTFASLGATPGTYTWTWGNEVNGNFDFFTLQIGPAATVVPAPPTLLLGLVGAGCVVWIRRQGR